MRYNYLFILIMPVVLFSCKKEKGTNTPDPVAPVPSVLLKDLTIPTLPSPYFHFEYNAAGKVIAATVESGFRMYDIAYSDNRISELRNNTMVNKDRLQYFYDAEGRVSAIKYVDEGRIVFKRCFLTYNGQKLINIEWDRKETAGFIIDREMDFVYYPDGNVMEIADEKKAIDGQPQENVLNRFEQYDSKVNTDGFMLLRDDIDHLLLLPNVQLQKNNPGKLIRTGDALNYEITYAYTYNERNLPLTKSGNVIVTGGANAGERFQTNAIFSYY